MPTYISLVRFTDQGIRAIKDGPTRLDAAKKAMQAAGGELKAWYLVVGSCDGVVVSEFPNDESAAKVLLQLGSQGNVRTETLRAFTEPEYRKLIGSL